MKGTCFLDVRARIFCSPRNIAPAKNLETCRMKRYVHQVPKKLGTGRQNLETCQMNRYTREIPKRSWAHTQKFRNMSNEQVRA
jgi:hypothetical protein